MKNNEKIESHVIEKYQLVKKLGSGAYGHVWKAKCRDTGKTVALKKIFDAFQHSTDAQRTFRQISILRQLKHDKVISLIEVIPAHNNQDIYLVFDYMESDLYHMIYDGKLQPVHVKYLMYQMVLGLHYLHACKLIHRDLKPSNILINSDCSIKICDFGLVRYLENEVIDTNMLTEGVATRWYRAPEVLLGSNSYGVKADIWSLGCILGQILLKNPMFPGNCTTNQLERILQFTGQPTIADIKSLETELGEVMIAQVAGMKLKKKADLFSKVEDTSVIDLVHKMLDLNPDKRPAASEILQHPYFSDFFDSKDLQVRRTPIFMEVSENVKLSSEEYLAIIKQKIVEKKSSVIVVGQPGSCKKENKRKVSESPKSFSELRKTRLSSTPNKNASLKKEDHSPIGKKQKSTNLFKELCKRKSASKDKKNAASFDKQNDSGNNAKTKNQSFSSLAHKFKEERSVGFSGLRKISKLNKV